MPSITDVIVVLLLIVMMAGILTYMKRSRKKNIGCIGCPDAPYCAKRQNNEACK